MSTISILYVILFDFLKILHYMLQLRELKRNFWSIVRFQGTSMLHKSVPECRDFECLAQ